MEPEENEQMLMIDAIESRLLVPEGMLEECREKIFKWKIKFSGQHSKKSGMSFLEKINNLCETHRVSENDLLVSALDLFTGTVECPQEDAMLYIIAVENLFRRLGKPTPKREIIDPILRNLNPFFSDRVGLQEINSLVQLKELCYKGCGRKNFLLANCLSCSKKLEGWCRPNSDSISKRYKYNIETKESSIKPHYQSGPVVNESRPLRQSEQIVNNFARSRDEWISWLLQVNSVMSVKSLPSLCTSVLFDNRLYLAIHVYVHYLVGLLDSGASHTIIRSKGLEFLRQYYLLSELIPCPVNIKTAALEKILLAQT
ncbi:hypothetical protein ILUMI_12200 [Ignelater luminosus]|uniref:Uncharacterized protein n=1 Tax=Ignelater luminosus TaxID=2038154 RepID=A0A8K0D010_IGNLU|nr:hypothetical protein ILUMI_12200 [Ignelater luminosus]